MPSVINWRAIAGAALVPASARGQETVGASAASAIQTRMERIMEKREAEDIRRGLCPASPEAARPMTMNAQGRWIDSRWPAWAQP